MKKNLLYVFIGLICVALIYWFSQRNTSSTLSGDALSDFAIKDTASIGKIFIADNKGELTLERRDDGFWELNGHMTAMPHHVKLMLKTFHNIGIQQPVPKSQLPTVMKIINGDNRKVKVYDREGEWIKTWYVGRATKSSQGTYAILETPQDGLSPDPFVIEIRGFRGFLTTRFHSNENDMRWTGLFNYPGLEVSEINVEYPRNPVNGFKIEIGDRFNGDLDLFDSNGFRVPGDKAKIGKFIGHFESANVEHFNLLLSPTQKDSMLALPPDCRLSVTDNSGVSTSCDVYMRPIADKTKVAMGYKAPEIDPERVWVFFNSELASGQRLTFDNLMISKGDLMFQ